MIPLRKYEEEREERYQEWKREQGRKIDEWNEEKGKWHKYAWERVIKKVK